MANNSRNNAVPGAREPHPAAADQKAAEAAKAAEAVEAETAEAEQALAAAKAEQAALEAQASADPTPEPGPETAPPGEAVPPSDEDSNKVEVETTGEFMLMDPYTLEVVPAKGSARVTRTTFIEDKLVAKQLREV